MRSNIEDSEIRNSKQKNVRWGSLRFEITGDMLIDQEGPIAYFLDPGGVNRQVTLPDFVNGRFYVISNVGSANTIEVLDGNAVSLVTLSVDDTALFISSVSEWVVAVGGSVGPQGAIGPAGTTLRSGSGAPSGGLGIDGEFYIDTTAWDIFGPKAAGVWPAGVSIIGPAGSPGDPGAAGAAGPPGPEVVGALKYSEAQSLSAGEKTQVFSNLGATAAGKSMVEAADTAAQTALLNAVVGDSGSGGTKGLVPAPSAGDSAAGKFLSAGGIFSVPFRPDDIRNFGAVSGGDAMAATLAAIAAGNSLFYPPGFTCSVGRIDIPKNFHIEARGARISLVGDNAGFRFNGGAITECSFLGGVLIGDNTNRDADSSKGQAGVVFGNDSGANVSNPLCMGTVVEYTNIGFLVSKGTGVGSDKTYNAKLIGVTARNIIGTVGGVGYGIIASQAPGTEIVSPTLANCQRHELYLAEGRNYSVVGGTIKDHRFGLSADGPEALVVARSRNVTLSGIVLDNNNCLSAVDIEAAETGGEAGENVLDGVTIDGLVIKNSSGRDISIGSATPATNGQTSNVTVKNFVCVTKSGNSAPSIRIGSGFGVKVCDGIIDHSAAAAGSVAIYLAADGGEQYLKEIEVKDNVIKTAGYAIKIASAVQTGTRRILSTKNRVSGGGVDFLFDGGEAATTNPNLSYDKDIDGQAPTVGAVIGLTGSRDVSTGTRVDFGATSVVYRNPVSGRTIPVRNTGSAALNIATAGPIVGGRDQSGAFSSNSTVYCYFIRKDDGTQGRLASLSATAPVLPSGYTTWAYAFTLVMSGSNFPAVYFEGDEVIAKTPISLGTNLSATIETSISVSSYVPADALSFRIVGNLSNSAATAQQYNTTIRAVTGVDYDYIYLGVPIDSAYSMNTFNVKIPNLSQSFYYLNSAANLRFNPSLRSYRVANGG